MRKGFLWALVPIAAGSLALAGVLAAGHWARGRLQEHPSYSIPFAAIECAAPEGMAREDFLAEVQFITGEHDSLPILDPSLPAHLAEVFAHHPWVEEVQGVEVLPGRHLRVKLAFRQAALAVRLMRGETPADGSVVLEAWAGQQRSGLVPCRAVDRYGVLLPVKATRKGLPILNASVKLPAGPAGTYWGDVRVAAAAAAAALLAPHHDRLGLADADWEIEGEGLILARPDVRIIWGRGPGREHRGEAPADEKIRRLLEYTGANRQLRGEYDLRPKQGAHQIEPTGAQGKGY
jgi:hypothetical protein